MARLDLREIEDVVEDVQQRFRRVLDRGNHLALAVVQARAFEDVEQADHAVHRRAYLVADRGEEVALGLRGRLGLVACMGQPARRQFLRGDVHPVTVPAHAAIRRRERHGIRTEVTDAPADLRTHRHVQGREFTRGTLEGVAKFLAILVRHGREHGRVAGEQVAGFHAEDALRIAADIAHRIGGIGAAHGLVHHRWNVGGDFGEPPFGPLATAGFPAQVEIGVADGDERDQQHRDERQHTPRDLAPRGADDVVGGEPRVADFLLAVRRQVDENAVDQGQQGARSWRTPTAMASLSPVGAATFSWPRKVSRMW